MPYVLVCVPPENDTLGSCPSAATTSKTKLPYGQYPIGFVPPREYIVPQPEQNSISSKVKNIAYLDTFFLLVFIEGQLLECGGRFCESEGNTCQGEGRGDAHLHKPRRANDEDRLVLL